jgi:hypothetical protein
VSTDLVWFLVGVWVGAFFGVGVSVVVAWRVVRALVRFAARSRGPDRTRAV